MTFSQPTHGQKTGRCISGQTDRSQSDGDEVYGTTYIPGGMPVWIGHVLREENPLFVCFDGCLQQLEQLRHVHAPVLIYTHVAQYRLVMHFTSYKQLNKVSP